MNWFVLGIISGGVVCYFAWHLTPPKDVIGSRLPGFDGQDRISRMIRDEANQDHDLFNS